MRITAVLLFVLFLFACRKDSFTTRRDAFLRISSDTLHFDTVFVTTGSTTRMLKVVNENNQGIRLGSVELRGGPGSPFRINVNGQVGTRFTNVDVPGGDSIYVFVTVKIDPSADSMPFVVRDSLELQYNGNRRWVQLEAFGRNARFFRSRRVLASETWNDDLPYVILGGLEVGAGATLTINAGCQVYLHADAPLLVNGTLQVKGKDSSRVVFTGDRLDALYRNLPASWPGIIFLQPSKDNLVEFAEIRNAYQAVVVQAPSVNGNPKLQLRETLIDNAYDAGIAASNGSIAARNLLVSNCGKNLLLVNGGDYQFVHCTAASMGSNYLTHNFPVLVISNYLEETGPVFNLHARFRNCIFWGEGGLVKNEAVVLRRDGSSFDVQFDHVLWRAEGNPANAAITNAIANQAPQFDTIDVAKNRYSFRLAEGSPALNKGVDAGVTTDLDGKPRPVGVPDLGCYERQ